MAKLDLKAVKKSMPELVGIDFGTTGIKVVRLKRIKGSIALVGVDLLPPLKEGAIDFELELPKGLVSHYAALAYTGENALVRVMQAPLAIDVRPEDIQLVLLKQLNVEDDFRAGCHMIHQSKGKGDSTVLAVAIPNKDASNILYLFSTGAPAPYSLEVSGLAAFSGFMSMYKERHVEDSICLIESGAKVTMVAFMVRGQPALVAKFSLGFDALNRRIESDLGVDTDMARTILAGGSVDISSSVDAVMSPFLRQLSVSRDFIERQNKTRVSNIYISGGMSNASHWTAPIQEALSVECRAWDPFEQIKIAAGVWPEKLENQQHRFAAAVGAALGGLREE